MAADRGTEQKTAVAGEDRRRVELRVPFVTLLKTALFALLVFAVYKLWGVIIMVTIAALLAVMLDPLVRLMERHRVPRGVAIALIAIVLFGLLAGLLFGIAPAMVSQIEDFGRQLPRLAQKLGQTLPGARSLIQALAADMQKPLSGGEVQHWLTRGLIAGRWAAEGLTALILVVVITIYLLVEGRKALEWLIAFARPAQRPRIHTTLQAVNPIILAYMRGQVITCCLCGGMSLITLSVLHVPGAIALAVLAFIADLVPVVGTIAMTVPAVGVAAAKSPFAAIVVLVVYIAYHLTESYWIIPRVYGTQMRLSTLTVLLAVLVGGTLQGALGAVLILPFVAAYRPIERIWLTERLGETVREHELVESRNEL